jgi:diguanylate cyclase (GGDEF)-like protein
MKENKFCVLIIDDEAMNIKVLKQMLEPEYEVLSAMTAEEAIEHADSALPDIVLLDILMPGMSGYRVMEFIRRTPATSSIPVIFTTGLDSNHDEEKGLGLGAADYLTKPFSRALVKARVRTHLLVTDSMKKAELAGLIDPLTQLPNRRNFERRLKMELLRALRDNAPISFVMFDIDFFKKYNDKYGHMQGDILLKEVARLIDSEAKRPADSTVRLGGEEFGMLLPETALDEAVVVAERTRLTIESAEVPLEDLSGVTNVTVSVGVSSMFPTPSITGAELMAAADECLYEAKSAGRNTVISAALN